MQTFFTKKIVLYFLVLQKKTFVKELHLLKSHILISFSFVFLPFPPPTKNRTKL